MCMYVCNHKIDVGYNGRNGSNEARRDFSWLSINEKYFVVN